MAFVRKQGKTKFMWLPVTTSTAIGADHLVAFSSGLLIEATSTTPSYSIMGVLRHAIASTDADFATSRLVEVEVPVEKNVVWEADVTSALLSTSYGVYYDITDGDHVATTASTYDIVQCVKYISATKGWFVLNMGCDGHAKA